MNSLSDQQAVGLQSAFASANSNCCAVCSALLSDDIRVRLSASNLKECQRCGGWTYLPRPSPAQLTALHDSEEYFDHPYFDLRRRVNQRIRFRCRSVFGLLGIAVDVAALRGQRMLDIGCDTGAFLQVAAEEFGITPVGVDVSRAAVAATRGHGIEAYSTSVEDAPAHLSGYAAITAIDVLEHVTVPSSFLRAVRDRLRPGGAVYVETPNIRSVVYRLGAVVSNLTHGRPAAVFERLFPAQHVQYFTVPGLTSLARDSGLEVAQIGTRALAWSDIAASTPVRLAMSMLQALDRLTDTRILIWCVLRRS